MSQLDREKLRARVRALLAKTEANGCSEEEALAAAAKAAALMRDYRLSAEELAVTDAAASTTLTDTGRERLWAAIAHVTNCAGLRTCDETGPICRYYGVEPGPQIAVYLRDICNRAIDTETAAFRKTDIYKRRRKTATRRQAVKDFTHGMADRLVSRLWDMFEPSMDEKLHALAIKARDGLHPNARAGKSMLPHRERFADANHAGYRAGGNVDLHHGVAGRGEVRRIGSGS